MGISWNNRTIADARLARVHGGLMAGGYVLRLGVEFDVLNWDEGVAPPVVLMAPARVWIQDPGGISLGLAHPEVFLPFTVSHYAGKAAVLFDLPLSQAAMEALERRRNGGGIALAVSLQAEVRRGTEVQRGWADLTASFNVSEWIMALEQAGYGRKLLFEVPIPTEPADSGSALELMESARRLLMSGHYAEVVAKCRMVLEGLTQELDEDLAMKAARAAQVKDRTSMQRELVMRQTAIEFAHLAHHPTGLSLDVAFDRNSAQMMLSITAALVSTALARRAASLRQP